MTTGTKTVRTVCPAHCGIDACGILAHVAGDRVVKVEPAEFPDPRYRRICLRGLSSLDVTYHPDRLRYPMKRVGQRGEGKFERISWDEALDTIAVKFKEIGAKYGWIEIYSENLLADGQALPVFLEPFETPLKPETGKYPLAFIQGHSRFRTHSMFANVSSLLAMNPEPVVEINPQDAAVRNIRNDDVVTVFNDRARTTLKAKLTEGIGPGVVNITQSWWIDQFRESSVNHLTHDVINPVQEKIKVRSHFVRSAVKGRRYILAT